MYRLGGNVQMAVKEGAEGRGTVGEVGEGAMCGDEREEGWDGKEMRRTELQDDVLTLVRVRK